MRYLGIKRAGPRSFERVENRVATKLQKTRLTAWKAPHIWRLTAADAAFIERSAFVSRLFLVGTTDARNQSNRGRMRVGSLTLSV
jgi:hypothetical protein